ncbi:MAG: hypothetical protein ACE5KM_11350 [Planctomycetaceae bacterium]
MTDRRFLGVTVLGDFILSEGVDDVLRNLRRIGATAVATNPTVTAPAAEGEGSFQPPSDAGTSPRVFDRPLFGRHALWVRSGVSFAPITGFYADSPYAPRTPNDLTEQHGQVIGEFIAAAKGAGLKVYLQVGAVRPSGLRDGDRPRRPDGTLPPNRMADTGSLASDAIRAYNRGYVRDLLSAYPAVDGFRPDWPEYPCYTAGEVLQDFSPHAERWATERGIDFAGIRTGMQSLVNSFADVTNDQLGKLPHTETLGALRARFPAVDDWLTLKAALSIDCLQHWREIITEAGGPAKELSANAFMPRYSDVTGFDFAEAAQICDAVSPKLYTMHWSQMVTFWGEWLQKRNPGLDECLLTGVLTRLMEIDDNPAGKTLADFGYPAPDERHPIADAPQRRKIAEVIAAVDGRCAVTPLVHGYGPPSDFRRRLQLVADSHADGVWINRYGYLGEEKLNAIAEFA